MANSDGARRWRVIFDGSHSGARNMARDEVLARALLEENSGPTLRFYSWEPSCLSLGRLQKIHGALQVLAERRAGLEWVRRPSGGRGVWHQAEVTYAFTIALDDLPPDSRSVVAAYAWLSRPLLLGLESLGVRATLSSSTSSAPKSANCFLATSQADAVVDGRKLIGGAQCRFEAHGRTSVLQHGSILIDLDASAWSRALGEDFEMGSALSLRDLGLGGSVAEVRQGVQEAVARALSEESEVEEGSMSPRECEWSYDLERHKYLSTPWNTNGVF